MVLLLKKWKYGKKSFTVMPEIKELCFEMLAKIGLVKNKTSSKSVGIKQYSKVVSGN